ncbi:response regulator [Roseateles amylovorans]|uniref:Response regulator n=1 Tax=Roseateles amylovorans TaxID=2978473 RepID=A0ABY6AVZ3_9BURK|nr:response regulator [Roseateles amylovorans]UXH76770.1 response regulator [Roseateles amylovorans]
MKQILVIDDAPTVRLYCRDLLERAGYGVDEACNGLEALEKALQQQFDLYLVDINMPRLDGYGFLNELRGQQISLAPAIVVSTEDSEHHKRQAYLAGANLFLLKPTRPEQLLEPIRLLLGEAQP